MSPGDQVLFFKEGQGQHCSISAYGPNNFIRLLSPSPADDGEAIEEMT